MLDIFTKMMTTALQFGPATLQVVLSLTYYSCDIWGKDREKAKDL